MLFSGKPSSWMPGPRGSAEPARLLKLMPLPKRKTSHAQTTRRRAANWKLTLPNVGSCPRCHAPRLSHHVCPSCGFYGNRLVMEPQTRRRQEEEPQAESGETPQE
jgi:large subunit ribosomal protein L32